MIPPIDLDVAIRLGQSFSAKGGNDVLTVPYNDDGHNYFFSHAKTRIKPE